MSRRAIHSDASSAVCLGGVTDMFIHGFVLLVMFERRMFGCTSPVNFGIKGRSSECCLTLNCVDLIILRTYLDTGV